MNALVDMTAMTTSFKDFVKKGGVMTEILKKQEKNRDIPAIAKEISLAYDKSHGDNVEDLKTEQTPPKKPHNQSQRIKTPAIYSASKSPVKQSTKASMRPTTASPFKKSTTKTEKAGRPQTAIAVHSGSKRPLVPLIGKALKQAVANKVEEEKVSLPSFIIEETQDKFIEVAEEKINQEV
jgi:hypothetical protein